MSGFPPFKKMGVDEAANLWDTTVDEILRLCQEGKIKALQIGNTWVIDKNQPNPLTK